MCIRDSLPRRPAVEDRRRDQDEAHSDPDFPLRRDGREGHADFAPARRGGGSEVSEATDIAAGALERVARELRDRERFLLTAHESPDGDALGSLLGMHKLLGQLGKDSVMILTAKKFKIPIEKNIVLIEEDINQ